MGGRGKKSAGNEQTEGNVNNDTIRPSIIIDGTLRGNLTPRIRQMSTICCIFFMIFTGNSIGKLV